MPQGDKSKKGQQVAARPGAVPHPSAHIPNRPGAGKNNGSGRKVPFGPVGGSGRKTNLARSS